MKSVNILVAEDDKNIRAGLVDTLESEGYKVTPAVDGQEALTLFRNEKFSLVILDIMMPGKSGYDVCREIRSQNEEVPIIMLTAKGEEIDKVVGLQLGADDYITKPFGVHELLARITAVMRRSSRTVNTDENFGQNLESFQFGPAEVDAVKYKLYKGDQTFDLSEREVRILKYFHENKNKVLSRDQLLNEIWGIDYYGTTRTLDQHIAQLRKKVEVDAKKPTVITTVHGVGYRFEED